jgi:hypothetical protein
MKTKISSPAALTARQRMNFTPNILLRTFLLLALFSTMPLLAYAQQPIPPGNDIVTPTYFSPDYPSTATEPCFNIDSVQANCVPIYINVNVHFFLDDNCEGKLATAPYVTANLNPTNAFNIAEQLIQKSNLFSTP